MPSAVIPSEHSQPAMPLAGQLAHQRSVRPGPLVLGTAFLKSPTRTADRDRTVSRRSKPSSRTALMGEQPNPWDLLQPQDATSRHRGAKPCRRYGLLGKISLLSPGYLLSVERHPFHQECRITSPDFRPCSTRPSHSQAPLCTYTQHLIANQAEGTFGRLRYLFRRQPPQLNYPPGTVPEPDHGPRFRHPIRPEWYFNNDSTHH